MLPGAWINIGDSGGQKETPERSPRSLIHSDDPHHPAGLDKTNLVGLICATTGRFHNCVVKIRPAPLDTICGASQHEAAESYLDSPITQPVVRVTPGFFVP